MEEPQMEGSVAKLIGSSPRSRAGRAIVGLVDAHAGLEAVSQRNRLTIPKYAKRAKTWANFEQKKNARYVEREGESGRASQRGLESCIES